MEQVKRVFSSIGSNARGTNYWRGGLTWVGEEGPELIDLPRGTKIYSNPESIRMAQAAAESLNMGLSSIADISNQTRVPKTATPAKGGDIHQHITIKKPNTAYTFGNSTKEFTGIKAACYGMGVIR